VAEAFEAAHPEFEALPAQAALTDARVNAPETLCAGPDGRWLRLWPHRHGTDGFFCRRLAEKALNSPNGPVTAATSAVSRGRLGW